MAAFAGQGMSLSGDQLQPEVLILLDHVEGAPLDLRNMSHKQAETLRRMKFEFFAHYRPRLPDVEE